MADTAILNKLMQAKAVLLHLMCLRNILLSGDMELNPGLVANNTSSPVLVSNTRADFLLNYRMLKYWLRPLKVGGGVIFLSLFHQLCGDSRHHLAIGNTAMQYLRWNPERFSNCSWKYGSTVVSACPCCHNSSCYQSCFWILKKIMQGSVWLN